MNNEEMNSTNYQIPHIVFESSLASQERTIKRLIMVLVTLILCWFITICIFVWYIGLPVEEVNTQTVDDIDKSSIHQSIGD